MGSHNINIVEIFKFMEVLEYDLSNIQQTLTTVLQTVHNSLGETEPQQPNLRFVNEIGKQNGTAPDNGNSCSQR